VDGGRLVYLYVGSADVGRDLTFYVDQLGGEVVWRITSGGTEVAAVRLGEGPLVLLADHRQPPSVLQIWAVDDLRGAAEGLRAAGWAGPQHTVEVPDGPCLILTDPSGNEIGLLEQVRPGVMERRTST
jgi:predicted enzyme related to lactoylglutathione lyase